MSHSRVKAIIFMDQWPHAPVHKLNETGTYMVTAGTYKKQHFFNTPLKLQILHDALHDITSEYGWNLQAWAVMVNHYHFVGVSSEKPKELSKLISKLHMVTAKEINIMDNTPGRKVWFQYWDNGITYETSYFARLKYVHNNPVHHGVVESAAKYKWCSAAWFEKAAEVSFRKTVESFKTDSINVDDDF